MANAPLYSAFASPATSIRQNQLLIAAALNRTTLLGGPPTAFTRLLTNQQRTQFLAALNKTGLDKQGNLVSSRSAVTSFAPGSTQLIGNVIKVHGTMRAHEATEKAGVVELDVDVDYIFVYAVEPPHQPTEWMRIVAQMAWTVIFSAWTGAATPFEPWVVFNDFFAGIKCGTDGYLHPDYPGNQAGAPAPSVSPSGTPVDPYATATPRPLGCQRTTGT
jgi:hypothetical protein